MSLAYAQRRMAVVDPLHAALLSRTRNRRQLEGFHLSEYSAVAIDTHMDEEAPEPAPEELRFLLVPDPVTVGDLASMLRVPPFQIIHWLMELNIFASLATPIDFGTASKLCSHLNVVARRR